MANGAGLWDHSNGMVAEKELVVNSIVGVVFGEVGCKAGWKEQTGVGRNSCRDGGCV